MGNKNPAKKLKEPECSKAEECSKADKASDSQQPVCGCRDDQPEYGCLKDLWERINTRVKHEDELIFKRLGPLLTYHGFVFGAFFLMQRTLLTNATLTEVALVNLLFSVVLGLGCSLCWVARQRIRAANDALRTLEGIWFDQQVRVAEFPRPLSRSIMLPSPSHSLSDPVSGKMPESQMPNEEWIPLSLGIVNIVCIVLGVVVCVLVAFGG